MADEPKLADPRHDEERLAHALVSRGFLTRDEAKSCRPAPDAAAGPALLLARLTAAGLLTAGQARRLGDELDGLLNQQIPGYQLLEKLGQGSMGKVYKARQLSMDRFVAVKILAPKFVSNPRYLEQFQREARIAARLSHNNIVQAIDVGSAGPLHYFVMELVQGRTLRADIDEGKVFEEHEAVDIVLQIAQALQHAARRGLVHRDIKPANIIRTPEGIAKLADLGLARGAGDEGANKQERGLSIGTPYYMSPEQVTAKSDIDTRADIYALGATFYHMVTGRPPFVRKGATSVLQAHLDEELTPPDHHNEALSSGLGEVVERMMAKDRRQRYQTPDDLIIDLGCLLAGDPPKLARQTMGAATLAGLHEGDAEDDRPPSEWTHAPWWLVAVLGGLLGLSALLNLMLALRG